MFLHSDFFQYTIFIPKVEKKVISIIEKTVNSDSIRNLLSGMIHVKVILVYNLRERDEFIAFLF